MARGESARASARRVRPDCRTGSRGRCRHIWRRQTTRTNPTISITRIGPNLGVSSCSTHRQTARDFIKFVTSADNQRNLFEAAGFAPTVAAVYEDPELRARVPYLELIRRGVETSRNRPVTPDYDDVSGTVQEFLTNTLSNPISADVMTDGLAERLVSVVGQR